LLCDNRPDSFLAQVLMERIARSGIFLLLLTQCAFAQTPTGSIIGVVRDPSGAVVAAAHVTVRSNSTGLARAITTSGAGDFSVPVLPAGEYQVSVEASGFQPVMRNAAVEAGETTVADFSLTIGDVNDSITVDTVTPQMHYDSHTIATVITQAQIQDIPLNGRNFLELAKLEPGVEPPSPSNNNRVFVPILGAPGSNTGSGGRGTRVTVDGGSTMAVGSFGAQMGFSQEVVQEFQVSLRISIFRQGLPTQEQSTW
jgi:hypothetical protein